MLLELAILKNFDAGTYKAGVQLAGSLTTYFDGVPVSRAIPTSAMVIGNRVILAIPGDNPKDACVIATWPQGSPGGAEVHGNEYHDPDFATLSDFLAHKTRHQYGGADELMLDPAQVISMGRPFYHFDGQVSEGWTQAYTGSAYGNLLPLDIDLETGATISSIARIYRTTASNRLSPVEIGTIKDYIFKAVFATKTAQEMWLVLTREGVSYPSPSGAKVGFRITNDKIYAHCANGSSYTEVEVATISTWVPIILRLASESSDGKAYFYVNGVLKATISTNLPAHYPYRIMLASYNAEAANKRFFLYNMEVIVPTA
jgi:hypothetical protein